MVEFIHSTQSANLAVLRERFRTATGDRAARVARWLLANCTDAQLRSIFNVTVGQTSALKTRLQAKADSLTTLEAQVGE